MTDITSPFAAALTLLWAPTGLIIAAFLGLLQFKVGAHHSEHVMRARQPTAARQHHGHSSACFAKTAAHLGD